MKDWSAVSGKYKAVWLFAMFDLPVTSIEKRRQYTQFRKLLLVNGFCKLQFSVYARYYRSEEACAPVRAMIKDRLPPEGQVRLLTVTDGQFGKQQIFEGKKKRKTEEETEQFLLF
jgi:CRISPR-associated protein Cas2